MGVVVPIEKAWMKLRSTLVEGQYWLGSVCQSLHHATLNVHRSTKRVRWAGRGDGFVHKPEDPPYIILLDWRNPSY